MIPVPLLNPKFATVPAAKPCELRVRGTSAPYFSSSTRVLAAGPMPTMRRSASSSLAPSQCTWRPKWVTKLPAGIGTELLALAARAVLEARPGSGLFLWVLEDNRAAQAFYRARGGRFAGTRVTSPPGGGASLVALRCVWRDPATLLSSTGPAAD